MSSRSDFDVPAGLDENHINLLVKVIKRVQPFLTKKDWEEIAAEEGSNAKATKERFRYLIHKLKAMDDFHKGKEPEQFTYEKAKSKADKKHTTAARGEGETRGGKTAKAVLADEEDGEEHGSVNLHSAAARG